MMLLCITVSSMVFILSVLVSLQIKRSSIRAEKRVNRLFLDKEKGNTEKKTKNKKYGSKLPWNNNLSEKIGEELASAGILMKPDEYMVIWSIAVVLPTVVGSIFTDSIITLITLAIICALAPPIYVHMKKEKRLMLFEKQLGDSLAVMSNCLKSGLTFQQAIDSISKEMPDPIAREFSRVTREIKYGNNLDKALMNMSNRINSRDLMLMVSAVLIQRQVGGNLSEILDNISVTIKERLKIKDEIRVLTATGRMSGMVIGFLPVAIGLILLLTNPSYIMLFFETTIGKILLCASVILEVIGFMVVQKIVNIKY